MRKLLLPALLLLVAATSWSQIIVHPETGEQGYFVSIPRMQETVEALKEREVYMTAYENLLVEVGSLRDANAHLRKLNNMLLGSSVVTGVLFAGMLLAWLLR